MQNDGSTLAGYTTNYVVQFYNNIAIPSGSWFRLLLPPGFGFGSNVAAYMTVNSVTTALVCTTGTDPTGRPLLMMKNLTTTLPSSTYRISVRNIVNAQSQGLSATTITFESMKQGTNTAYEQWQFQKLTMSAGTINNPVITGSPLNMNIQITYTISFYPSNTVPQGGKITITFPPTFIAIDSSCIVQYGATAATTGSLSCVGDSATLTYTISGFADIVPQFIQITGKATNPAVSGVTGQFSISTYGTSGGLIDQNTAAGVVVISSVDSPSYTAVDLYEALTNSSLFQTSPLDYRVYPSLPDAVPATTDPATPPYGVVWLQIPMWWDPVAAYEIYRCRWGPELAAQCDEHNQVLRVWTPAAHGLGPCELPISVDSIRVTPIPGRWDFRVHTFNANPRGSTLAAPLEQDLYTMDIPATQFTTCTAYTTSLDSGDTDTILGVNFRTVIAIPYEGAINFNFSVVEDIPNDVAAWDPTLGFNFGTDSFIKISCRVMINSDTTANIAGHSTSTYPSVTCFAFKGDTTAGAIQNAIIQVTGFGRVIAANTVVQVDIPNILIPTSYTMKAQFTLTTSYTTYLTNPYTLNYKVITLGNINTDPMAVTNTPGSITPVPTFNPTTICQDATYTFQFTPLQTLTSGDNVLFKFPANKFTFKRRGITSPDGTVRVIYFNNQGEDQIYFLLTLSTTKASGALRTFRLVGVRNSNGEITRPTADFSGIVVSVIYWANYAKIETFTYGITGDYTDGGIYGEAWNVLPDGTGNMPGPRDPGSMNLEDRIYQTLTFSVCHTVLPNEGLKITLPAPISPAAPSATEYEDMDSTCDIISGLTGQTTTLGFTHTMTCTRVGNAYQIVNFQQIPQFQTISIGFWVSSQSVAVTPGVINIESYYDVPGWSEVNDYLIGGFAPPAVPGPKRAPYVARITSWLKMPQICRIGTSCNFKLNIKTNFDIPLFNDGTRPYGTRFIRFTIPAAAGAGVTAGGPKYGTKRLECRINGLLSYRCQGWYNAALDYNIDMEMSQLAGITANTATTITLETRGGGGNNNRVEGIEFQNPGVYALTIAVMNGGGVVETSQLQFEVYARDFLKFWVNNICKGKGQPTMVQVKFQPLDPTIIPASNSPNPVQMVVEFDRTASPSTTGWAYDLGTGLAHRSQIPCIAIGLTALPDVKINCTLYHGVFNNPTKVIMTGFDEWQQTGTDTLEVHVPKIFNPNNDLAIENPTVGFRIQQIDAATGAVTDLYYGHYDLLNVTYPQNPSPTAETFTTPTVPAPTLSVNTLQTPATLSISIRCTAGMWIDDWVILQLPTVWQPVSTAAAGFTCNFNTAPATATCVNYPTANQIAIHLQGSMGASTTIAGTIDLDTPPAVVPLDQLIVGYYYVKNKLINVATYPPLATVLIPFPIPVYTLTSDNLVNSEIATYTLSMVIDYDIPYGGAIQVKIPTDYGLFNPTCTNDAVGGSTLQDQGLMCTVDQVTGEMRVYGFPHFVAPALIVLQVQVTNPASPMTNPPDWEVATFYTNAPILQETICQNTAVVAPTLTPTTPAEPETWDTQYLYRHTCHITENCPLEFIVNLRTALAVGDTMEVTMPSTFTLSPESQVFCYWYDNETQYSSPPCTFTAGGSNVVKISSPAGGASIPAGENVRLTVTTLNGDQGKNGIVMPGTPGNYTFTVARKTGGTVLEETSSTSIEVLMTRFTAYKTTAFVVNYDMLTAIAIQFTPSTTIPASSGGGKLIVTLPTRTPDGAPLYANDLGSGVADGGSLPCHETTGTLGTWVCTISYGDQGIGKAVTITVNGWTGTLNAGTSYRFILAQIYNPTSGDNKHVYVKTQSFSGTTPLNADIMYDYTIQKWESVLADNSAANGNWLPTTVPATPGSTGVSFTLNLRTDNPDGFVDVNIYDYFIIEFPSPVTVPLSTATGLRCQNGAGVYYNCESIPGNRWVVLYDFGGNLAAGAFKTLQIIGANQAPGLMVFKIKTYAVKYRAVSHAYIYSPIDFGATTASTFVNPTIKTRDVATGFIPYSTKLQFAITFQTMTGAGAMTIPKGGALEIVPSPNLASVDPFCETISGLTGDVQCVCTATSCLITNFNDITAGSTVSMSLWGTTGSAATNGGWEINAYLDEEKSVKVFSSTGLTGDAISTSYQGFKQVYVPDTLPQIIQTTRAGEKGRFEFRFIPGSSWTAASYLTITFPTGVSLPAGAKLFCGFDNMEASLCTTTATNPLTIEMYAPHTPALAATANYNAWITTQCDTDSSATNGLLFSTAGTHVATVAFGATTTSVPFKVLVASDFTSLTLIPFWSNAGAENHLAVTLTPATTIPLGGKIVVTFPTRSSDGTITLFSPTLGYSSVTSSGSEIPCFARQSTLQPVADEIICKLYYGSGDSSWVEVTGFKAVSSGTSIGFLIRGFTNPSAGADNAHIDMEVRTEGTSNNVLNQRYVRDVFTTQTVGTVNVQTAGSYTRGSNVLLAAPVAYTFSSIQSGSPSITAQSKIIFEFPTTFNLPESITTTSPSGTLTVFANYVILQPSGTVASTYSVTLNGVQNPRSQGNLPINIYTVAYRSYFQKAIYNSPSDFTGGSVTVSVTGTTQLAASQVNEVTLSISPASTPIPAGGRIQIEFTGAQGIARVECLTTIKTTVTTGSTGTTTAWIDLSKSYALSDGAISVRVTIVNPSAAGAQSIKTSLLLSGSVATSIIATNTLASAYTTVATMGALTSYSLSSLVKNAATVATFDYTASDTTVTVLKITPTGFAIPGSLTCTLNGSPVTCTASAGVITTSAFAITVVKNTFTVTLTNNAAVGTQEYFLVQGYSGATLVDSAMSPVYDTVTSAFTSFTPNYGTNTAGTTTFVSAKFQISSAVTNPYIYFDFSPEYATNLGVASWTNGGQVPCGSPTLTGLVCTLTYGTAVSSVTKYGARITVTGLTTLSGTHEIAVFNLLTPTTVDASCSVLFKISTISVGNNENDQYGAFIVTAPLLAAAGATGTGSFAVPTTAVQSTNNIGISLAGQAATANSQVLLILPGVYFNLASYSGITCSVGSCTYYPYGGAIVWKATGAVADPITFTINGLTNPVHLPAPNIKAYLYNPLSGTGDFVQSWTLTPATAYTEGLFFGVDLSLLDTSSALATMYSLAFTTTKYVPSQGKLQLEFPLATCSATWAVGDLKVISGGPTGSLYASATRTASQCIVTFSGFTAWPAGSTSMIFSLTGTLASGNGNMYTYADSTTSYIIEKTAVTLPYNAAGTFSAKSGSVYLPQWKNVIKNGYGDLLFAFQTVTASLNKASHNIYITVPTTTFPITYTGYLRCKFINQAGTSSSTSYLSDYCYKDSTGNLVIAPPTSTALANTNEWLISVFAVESDRRGLTYPNTNTAQKFQFDLKNAALSTIIETNVVYYRIFNGVMSNSGCTMSYTANTGAHNLIDVRFRTTNAIPAYSAGGAIMIEIPVWKAGVQVQSTDLGTGQNDLTEVYCVAKSGITSAASPNLFRCFLQLGDTLGNRPARILVQNFQAIGANTFVEVTVSIYNYGTVGLWSSASIVTMGSSTAYLDMYYNPYLTYTANPAVVSTTVVNFPTLSSYVVQTSTGFTLSVAPSTSTTITKDDRFRFLFNDRMQSPTTMAVNAPGSSSLDRWADNEVFVTPPTTYASTSTPVNLGFTGLVGPISTVAFTSEFEVQIIQRKVVTYIVQFTATNPTFTPGTISPASVVPSSTNSGDNSQDVFTFTPAHKIPEGGAISITLPAGFGPTGCTAISGITAYTSCTATGQVVTMTGVNEITGGTQLKIAIWANNPSATGSTGTFTIQTFEDDAATMLIDQNTAVAGFTVGGTAALNYLFLSDPLYPKVRAQAYDNAPLQFTIAPTADVNPLSSLDITHAAATYFTTTWQDIVGFITDLSTGTRYAAQRIDVTTTPWKVYAPLETSITAGGKYLVYLWLNRNHPTYGFDYPAANSDDCVVGGETKQLVIPLQNFVNPWIVSRITTADRFSTFYFELGIPVGVPGGSNALDQYTSNNVDYGQIIFQFYTMDKAGKTLMPTDLGKGINNGDPVDCYSVTTGVNFNCKIGLGAPAHSVPSSIILVPSVNIPEGTTIRIHFPKIRLTATDGLLNFMKAFSRTYDSAAQAWTQLNFMLYRPFFYTTTSTVVTTTIGSAPGWTNNLVGAFGTATFTFPMTALGGNNILQANTYDRVVLETVTDGMALQDDSIYPIGCAIGNTRAYQESLWVELDLTTPQNGGGSRTVTYTNFKNAPYQILTGVTWTLYIWKDADLKQIINYNPVAMPDPNVFTNQGITWIITPLTSGIQDYWITFQGTNPVPTDGKFTINIPLTFQAIGSQCLVLAGLKNPDCSVQDTPTAKTIVITLSNPYDPVVDGTINVKFTATNPATAGNTAQFTLTSNWPTGEKIDESLALGFVPITAVLNLILFELTSLQQWQINTCGGDPGPIRLELSLRENYAYTSFSTGDFIEINLGTPGFGVPALVDEWTELLCWFDFPNIAEPIEHVKTHDCRWNGGNLHVRIPEEQSIVANQIFYLTIYTRGSNVIYNDGIIAPTPPGKYWMHMTTSKTTEESFLLEIIPACPLNAFTGEAYVHDAGQTTNFEFWFEPTTTVPVTSQGGRILVEIPTHNELIPMYDVDVGFGIGANAAAPIGCGGRNNGGTLTYDTALNTNGVVTCNLYAPPSQDPTTPAYIYSVDLQRLTAGTLYNFQVARILNPTITVDNDDRYFVHIRIRLQQLVNGAYIDTNDHTAWHLISYLRTYAPGTTASCTTSCTDSRVNITPYLFTYSFNPFGFTLDTQQRIIFQYDNIDWLLPNSATCQWYQNTVDNAYVRCVPMRFSYWLTTDIALDIDNDYWEFRLYSSITNPYYRIQGGIPLKVWVVSGNRIVGYFTCIYQNTNNNVEIVMQTPSTTNDVSLELTYQIGIYIQTGHKNLAYFKLNMPGEIGGNGFYPLSQTCLVRRGLIPVDVTDPSNPITCTIDSSTWPQGKSSYNIRIYNFGRFSQSYTPYFVIFEMQLRNPPTAGWTRTWSAYTYDNYEVDLTRTMDVNTASDGRTWVGIKPFPIMVRVYRNTKAFEDRRCQSGQWCEISIRVITKSNIPPYVGSSGGRAEVWLPSEYSIPNGATPICVNGNGDDTSVWRNTDLDGQFCEITSDRKVIFNLDNSTGIKQNTCQMMYLYSEGASGTPNGFQAPSSPGLDNFQVYFYHDSQLLEFANTNAMTNPVAPLTVTWSENPFREHTYDTVFRIRFDVSATIPAGYITNTNLDVTQQTTTRIVINFNSQQTVCCWAGWAANLGYYNEGTEVPCKVISGLVAGPEGIKCVISQPTTLNSPDFPVRVIISGFQEIIEGTTNIEIHIVKVRNPGYENNGLMQIGAYTIYGPNSANPTTVWIVKPVSFYLPSVERQYGFQYEISPDMPIIDPNTVGALINVDLQFDQAGDMNPGDDYWLKFPAAKTAPYASYSDPLFNLPDDGSISAVVAGIQLNVVVYNDPFVNWIFFRIPAGAGTIVANPDQVMKISQLRNMAWADPNTWDLELWCIKNKRRIQMTKWSALAPATASNFNSLVFTSSSPFANDVYVTNYFKFVPSYDIPAGSQFTITFPSPDFDILTGSSPAAICSIVSSEYLTGCVIGASTVTFTASADISLGTPLEIDLIGCKNPATATTYATGAISMQVAHPPPATSPVFYPLINSGPFNGITYKSPLTPSQIYILVNPSSVYVGVTASYTFSVQNSRFLPTGGMLYLQFPPNWRYSQPGNVAKTITVSTITGSWTSAKLTYTSSYISATGVYQILTGFDWPAKQTLYININSFTNPDIADFVSPTTYESGLFQSYTQYDGVILDETDPTDTSTNIVYQTYTNIFNTPTTSISPTTGGEIATYDLSMSTTSAIPPGSTFEMEFPSGFSSTLTTYDTTLSVVLTIGGVEQTVVCTVENGKLSIPLSAGINAGETFSISIAGISNPNEGTSGDISFKVTDSNNQVIGYTPTGMTVAPTSPPTFWDLSSLSTTSTSLQTKSDYTLCVTTDRALSDTDEIWVTFPPQFGIRGTSYECAVGSDTENGFTYPSSGPTCQVQNNERKFLITGQTNSLPAGPPSHKLCYVIKNVENPGDSGQSGNFVVSLYDKAANEVALKTSGLLSYPSTITYSRQGYRVIVDSIPDFPLGLMSKSITVTLEIKVTYTVELIPTCAGFTFQPSIITFYSYLPASQTFRIVPNPTTPTGSYMITWTKYEDNSVEQFSEVPDTAFNYVPTPQYQELTLTIGVAVSRTALGSTSLPISITLSQSPALPMTVYYNTIKPSQPDQIIFEPNPMVFQPGETVKTFTYTSNSQAVSGEIQFTIDDTYASKYYMENDIINFEILDVDVQEPAVLDDYIVDMDRTWLYYRVSSSESAWVYWMLTYEGTLTPPCDELKNSTLRGVRGTKTDVTEIFGANSSYQTPVTTSYIYYDTYLKITGLEEQTDYVLFYCVYDLSGNVNGTHVRRFTTLKKHQPAIFSVALTDDTNTTTMINSFSLITGIIQSRFSVLSAPPKFTIPGNTDATIASIIANTTVVYQFILYQNITADENSPRKYIQSIENSKYLLVKQIPTVVSSFDIVSNSYEVIQVGQEFVKRPSLVAVGEDYAEFEVGLKRNGTLYAIVQLANFSAPNPRQIKHCLDSTNFNLSKGSCIAVEVVYPQKVQYGVYKTFKISFTGLLDFTEYKVFIIGENTLPVNPDLMEKSDIASLEFTTMMEVFSVVDWYQSASLLSSSFLLLCLMLGVLLFI